MKFLQTRLILSVLALATALGFTACGEPVETRDGEVITLDHDGLAGTVPPEVVDERAENAALAELTVRFEEDAPTVNAVAVQPAPTAEQVRTLLLLLLCSADLS